MDIPAAFITEVRNNCLKEGVSYDDFLETFIDFGAQNIDTNLLIENTMKFFHGKQNLILEFNKFLPEEHKIVSKEEDEALSFVKRVKTTFNDDHGAFSKFLQIMDAYGSKNKSIIEVYKEIDILFQGHNDLFIEFTTFLPDTSVKSSNSPPLDNMRAKKKQKIKDNSNEKRTRDKGLTFFDKVKATVSDSNTCQGLMKCVELHSNSIITRQELHDLVNDLIGQYPQLVKGFEAFMENSDKTEKSEIVCSSKYRDKRFKGLNLFRCENISPSYWRLPMKYREPDIMHESLNDGFVCKIPEKEDSTSRPVNEYVKKLFECEDEMFELDMKVHLIDETILRTQALLQEVEGKKSYLNLEEHFSARQLSYIKNFFEEKKLKVSDFPRVNAYILLPTVLEHLISEQAKLAQIQNGSVVKWRKNFKCNHCRSLGFA